MTGPGAINRVDAGADPAALDRGDNRADPTAFHRADAGANPAGFDHVDVGVKRSPHSAKWSQYGPDVLPAWVAEHDFRQPDSVIEAMRATIDRGELGYHRRDFEVAEAFGGWARSRYGWDPDPALTSVCVDALQGVVAAVTALAGPGEGVILTPPVYHVFWQICPTSGRRPVEWPMRRGPDGWRLDPDDLEAVAAADPGAKVLLLSHPQNPTGRVADRDTLARIVELARDRGLYVVSDEIHGDMVYPPAEFVPMLSLDGATDRVMTVTSPAKTFALSGLRCALTVFGCPELRRRVIEAHPPLLLGHASRIGIDASVAAWTEGGAWADRLLDQLRANRDHLARRLAAEAPAVRMHLPESTFLAWLDVSACGLGDRPAAALLERARVALLEGTEFGTGGEGCVRLNFGTSEALLDAIIDRLIPHLQ